VRPAGATALAILLGLVAPLAVGSFTWQQRSALAVLLFAAAWASGGLALRASGRRELVLLVASFVALVVTLPLAGTSEAAARAAAERRAGERLVALNEEQRALPHLEAAGANQEAAALHLELAEADVAGGLSADAYADAGAHLDRALALAPSPKAEQLSEAVKAVRFADIIWNQYDWPRTIGELKKAEALRPDLPGLKEKLAAAEASARLAGG